MEGLGGEWDTPGRQWRQEDGERGEKEEAARIRELGVAVPVCNPSDQMTL